MKRSLRHNFICRYLSSFLTFVICFVWLPSNAKSSQWLAPPSSLIETPEKKRERLRSEYFVEAFQEADGIEFFPMLMALMHQGVLDWLPKSDSGQFISLQEIAQRTNAVGPAYVGAGLVAMGMQGWVKVQKVQVPDTDPVQEIWQFRWTKEGEAAREVLKHPAVRQAFRKALAFLPHAVAMKDLLFDPNADGPASEMYKEMVTMSGLQWAIPRMENPLEEKAVHQIIRHLDGLIVGPTMVAIGMHGHEQGEENELASRIVKKQVRSLHEIDGHRKNLEQAFRLLGQPHRQWVKVEDDGSIHVTPRGEQALTRTHLYGVPVSYLAQMEIAHHLMFVNPDPDRMLPDGITEKYVDREMNIWASGKAHADYFKHALKFYRQLIDNADPNRPPQAAVDVGSGYGKFLLMLYRERPLFMVGVDLYQAARNATAHTLNLAGIDHLVTSGNVSDPQSIADDLTINGNGIDFKRCVHVRSVLDHDRDYERPVRNKGIPAGQSQVIFAERGQVLSSALLEQSLVEHFLNWAEFSEEFGMIIIEGPHALAPEIAARNLGRTSAISYYLTHALSDQYTVEWPVYIAAARRAGLEPVGEPVLLRSKGLPVVSIVHFRKAKPVPPAEVRPLDTDALAAQLRGLLRQYRAVYPYNSLPLRSLMELWGNIGEWIAPVRISEESIPTAGREDILTYLRHAQAAHRLLDTILNEQVVKREAPQGATVGNLRRETAFSVMQFMNAVRDLASILERYSVPMSTPMQGNTREELVGLLAYKPGEQAQRIRFDAMEEILGRKAETEDKMSRLAEAIFSMYLGSDSVPIEELEANDKLLERLVAMTRGYVGSETQGTRADMQRMKLQAFMAREALRGVAESLAGMLNLFRIRTNPRFANEPAWEYLVDCVRFEEMDADKLPLLFPRRNPQAILSLLRAIFTASLEEEAPLAIREKVKIATGAPSPAQEMGRKLHWHLVDRDIQAPLDNVPIRQAYFLWGELEGIYRQLGTLSKRDVIAGQLRQVFGRLNPRALEARKVFEKGDVIGKGRSDRKAPLSLLDGADRDTLIRFLESMIEMVNALRTTPASPKSPDDPSGTGPVQGSA